MSVKHRSERDSGMSAHRGAYFRLVSVDKTIAAQLVEARHLRAHEPHPPPAMQRCR